MVSRTMCLYTKHSRWYFVYARHKVCAEFTEIVEMRLTHVHEFKAPLHAGTNQITADHNFNFITNVSTRYNI